jgi:hypothetical protein
VIERLAHAVIRHKEVHKTIVVEISEGDAESFAVRIRDACFDANIFDEARIRLL